VISLSLQQLREDQSLSGYKPFLAAEQIANDANIHERELVRQMLKTVLTALTEVIF
jgi:hypothetical protein